MTITLSYDHELTQGEDYQFEVVFTVEPDSSTPLNLTGFTFECVVRNSVGAIVVVGEQVSVVPSLGKVTYKLPAVQTRFCRGLMVLQLKATGATGNIQYAIQGWCQIHANGSNEVRQISGQLFGVVG